MLINNKITFIIFSFIIVFALSIQNSIAQNEPGVTDISQIRWSEKISEEISEKIVSYMEQSNTQGVALAIIRDGKILKRSFYGFAITEEQIPITEKSEFWLASIAKHLTTSLVLDLEEDRIISREDLISKYIPNLPESWKNIKVVNLMNHTSGILDNSYNNPDGVDFADLLNAYAPGSPSLDEFIDLLKDVNVGFPAGTDYNYSDIGMMVLAIVVSKASGKPFNEIMSERIFGPAKMSSYFINPSETHPNQVKGYTCEEWQLQEDKNRKSVLATDQRTFGGAGSIFVTLDDMINWNNALNENIILNKETKELLWNKYELPSGKTSSTGLGLIHKDYPGGYAIGHDGAAGTEYWKFPEYNTDIILLTNHGGSMASKGIIALVSDALGLLDTIDEEFFINAMQIKKAALKEDCKLSGRYKILTPLSSYYYIDFYQKDETPFVMLQGIPIELIPIENCSYIGYSKALFFPGLIPPHFEVVEETINWVFGPQKLPLIKVYD